MLYKIRKDNYVRVYKDFGYITSVGLFNDLVVDSSGAIFLSVLLYEPQSLDELVDKILPYFENADRNQIEIDAAEFYNMLVEDEYLVSGNTLDELRKRDIGFTYDSKDPVTQKKDFSPQTIRSVNDTQNTLNGYFLEHPQLISFQMELTNKCNERCIHCYIPHKDKINIMKPQLFYDVLSQLSDLGVYQLTLSGGEPMLHPDFVDFVYAAKEKNIFVSVLSNLTLLTDDIVKALKWKAVSSVQVSLYSMNPEHHDSITKLPGSHAKTVSSILKLIENNIPVYISCPTMKQNKSDFREVLEWANNHKISANTDYSIMAEYDHCADNLCHRLSPKECGEVISDIVEFDQDYQREILQVGFVKRIKEFQVNPDSRFCGVGISTCCMSSTGLVFPCPSWQSYICGNLNENSLIDIWENSQKLNHLRGIKRKDIPKCIDCENAAFCSPCFARNANESLDGNMLEVNEYFCDVAAMNKEIVFNYIKNHKKQDNM